MWGPTDPHLLLSLPAGAVGRRPEKGRAGPRAPEEARLRGSGSSGAREFPASHLQKVAREGSVAPGERAQEQRRRAGGAGGKDGLHRWERAALVQGAEGEGGEAPAVNFVSLLTPAPGAPRPLPSQSHVTPR